MNRKRTVVITLILIVLFGAVYVSDRLLAKTSRLDKDACLNNMVSVGDAILRFELENHRRVASLDELVPKYVAEQMVYCRECWKDDREISGDGRFRYLYDPVARTIIDPAPHVINGLFSRRAEVLVWRVPEGNADLFAKSDTTEGRVLSTISLQTAQSGEGVEVREPPEGAIVIEAEGFAHMNYGWEIKRDPSCSRGAYLFIKEGVANSIAQDRGFGDYYNVGDNRSRNELFYRFNIPTAGWYSIQDRVMVTGTHCSNQQHLFVDGSEQFLLGSRPYQTQPFVWFWDDPKRIWLEKGIHEIQIFPHEDGVRIDQIVVLPGDKRIWGGIYRTTSRNRSRGDKKLYIVHDYDTRVLSNGRLPEFNVWLRRTGNMSGEAFLKVFVELSGQTMILCSIPVDLSKLKPLSYVAIDLSSLDVSGISRREFLLKSQIVADGKPLVEATTALIRPYKWRILGMLHFIPQLDSYVADGWANKSEYESVGVKYSWKWFKDDWYDQFGVLDFGLAYADNSIHAPMGKTVYAQTVINVPNDGRYLFKMLADDQMILWIDGEEVSRNNKVSPVTRSSQWEHFALKAGEHKLQIRINQRRDRWQAAVFIRDECDNVSDVTGVDWNSAPTEPVK